MAIETQERDTQQIREDLEKRIASSEKQIRGWQRDMDDPEKYHECGYYLQQAIYAEQAYCQVLYDKISRL
jgi:hypothetical protein